MNNLDAAGFINSLESDGDLGKAEQLKALAQGLPPRAKSLLAALTVGMPGSEELFGHMDLPNWVDRLGRQTRETLFPGLEALNDPTKDFKLLGAWSGTLRDVMTEIENTTPPVDPTALLLEANEVFNPLVQSIVCGVTNLPMKDQKDFFDGHGAGVIPKVSDIVSPNGSLLVGPPKFLIRLYLLCLWPEVEKLGSSTKLYDFLIDPFGTRALGDLDSFRRWCRALGIYKQSKRRATV